MIYDLNGKSCYVESSKVWEFKDGLRDDIEISPGEKPTTFLREYGKFVEAGMN